MRIAPMHQILVNKQGVKFSLCVRLNIACAYYGGRRMSDLGSLIES